MKDLELQLQESAKRLDAAIKRELELRKQAKSKNTLATLIDPFDLSKGEKKAMKELTKGDLVMTDMGLAWYDRIENGEHLVNPITWENNHLSPHFNASPPTRAQVEEKIKEMGWKHQMAGIVELAVWGTYNKKGNLFTVEERDKKWHLCCHHLNSKDFDTAPTQLAEAILVARMLNATKD